VKFWRLSLAIVLVGLIAVPLGLPLGFSLLKLFQSSDAWQALNEPDRQRDAARNSAELVAGTLAIAVPLGVLAAVLLYRSDLPGRRVFRLLTILTLFVPLPLFASAWQATLGIGGWLAAIGWLSITPPSAEVAAMPWTQGLPAAIWVHAMAGLPWIIWLTGQGLCWVEPELEEEALLSASPWRVLWRVTLPRSTAAIGLAALVVAIQTATEITITDVTVVRTFAEEVYLQLVILRPDILASAVVVCIPQLVIVIVLVFYAARRWERRLPSLEQVAPPLCLFRLGKARWPIFLIILNLVALFAGVPVLALVWKAGRTGSPVVWSALYTLQQLGSVAIGKGGLIAETMLLAGCTGLVAVALALPASWLSVESRPFRVLLLFMLAIALAMPGPVVGFGLKLAINHILSVEELIFPPYAGPMRFLLYDGPSMLPVLWVCVIRFFPVAVAILWPTVRMLPVELREAARVDGATPVDEFFRVVLPLTRRACLMAALAVAVLSLGELSAGKLVETPGSTTLAHVIFEQMHRGVPSDVAALCLVLLLAVAAGGALVGAISRKGEPAA
jgi:iron(III) transport system permease protein